MLTIVVARLMCDGVVDFERFDPRAEPRLVAAAIAALVRFPGAGAFDGSVLRLFDPCAARLVAHAIETALSDTPVHHRRYSQAR